MSLRTDPLSSWSAFGDRRVFAVKVFVVLCTVALMATVLYCILRRAPMVAAAPLTGATEAKTLPPHEPELLVNEYVLGDRWVVQAVVPGVKPSFSIGYEPNTRRLVLSISSVPIQNTDDEKIRYNRQEWQPGAFMRTIPLPEGVSSPDSTFKDGILTLSFPHHAMAETNRSHQAP